VNGCAETDDPPASLRVHDESEAPEVATSDSVQTSISDSVQPPTSDSVQTPTSDSVQTPTSDSVPSHAKNVQVLGQKENESESESGSESFPAAASCDKVDNTNSGRASHKTHALVVFASGEPNCFQSSDSLAANQVIQSRSGRQRAAADFIVCETAEHQQNYSEEAQKCEPVLSAPHSEKCLETRDRELGPQSRHLGKKNGAAHAAGAAHAGHAGHAGHAAETFSGRANAARFLQTPNDPRNKKKEKPVQKSVERRHTAQTYVSKLEMNKIKSNMDLREMLHETINNGYESQFEKASKLRITRY
jgi:hypothetical protein